jgi:hypothetical protein
MRSLNLALASLLIIFTIIFTLPSYASGQGQGQAEDTGFRISPVPASDPAITARGYFIYKVQSSTNVTGSVMLKNPSSVPLTIQLAAVDAITAQTGGSAFTTSDVTLTRAGTWLKFAETSVTLPAGMQKPVDFTVTVPKNLKPGQYLAGISAYIPTVPPTAVAGQDGTKMGASITTQTRYVIGVQLDVQGVWTPSLKIETVDLVQQPSGPFIGVTLKNDGDEFLKPSGSLVMTDTTGTRVLDQPIDMGTFVPGTSVLFPVKWSGVMAPGMYHVHVRLSYAKTGIAIYDSPLEISAASVAKVTAETTEVPGVIGSISPAIDSPQAPVTTQSEEGSGLWLWLLISTGILLFAIAPLLTLYRAKKWKVHLQSEAL